MAGPDPARPCKPAGKGKHTAFAKTPIFQPPARAQRTFNRRHTPSQPRIQRQGTVRASQRGEGRPDQPRRYNRPDPPGPARRANRHCAAPRSHPPPRAADGAFYCTAKPVMESKRGKKSSPGPARRRGTSPAAPPGGAEARPPRPVPFRRCPGMHRAEEGGGRHGSPSPWQRVAATCGALSPASPFHRPSRKAGIASGPPKLG